MINQDQIKKATRIIANTIHPEKIYLFGSYANGNATEKSDIDLLIIMPDRSKKKYEVAEEIEKEIRNVLPAYQDLIIDYTDKFNRHRFIPYSFLGHIVNTGILLYES